MVEKWRMQRFATSVETLNVSGGIDLQRIYRF